MAYQDFEGKGDSKSHEKLQAIRLDDFANVTKRDKANPLAGLSILDLGCNEGFFCVEAIKQGARRVVGIDSAARFIDAAKVRCPGANFIHGSWWQIPDEKFDVIFFLSAVHYEPKQKEFFSKLRSHLTHNGTLILECGVARGRAGRYWYTANRADGPKRYPTEDLLLHDLLAGYAVRYVGPSINQAGDPVTRFVYHCQVKSSTAIIVGAHAGSGKTTLAAALSRHGIPSYGTDEALGRLMSDSAYGWSPLASVLKQNFANRHPVNFSEIALFVRDNGLHEQFCDILASECPTECELFCIEGDALRHPNIMTALVQRLRTMGVRVWNLAAAS